MSANEQQIRDLIAEQAAEWFVENRAGLNAAQRREFAAWLKVSPVHVEEYLALAALTRDLAGASRAGDATIEAVVARSASGDAPTVLRLHPRRAVSQPLSRRWAGLALAASVLLLGVGLLLTRGYWTPHPGPRELAAALHLKTRHGEQQTYRLADQSVVHLNTDTSLTVRFDAHERFVALESGEAVFEVAHEARRAFRVSTGSAQVIAVGTQFDVRIVPEATLITVSEGRVKVAPGADIEHPLTYREVGAGEQIRVTPGEWPARAVAVDVQRTSSWLQGKLRFDDEPLASVTAELNRYATLPYDITTPALKALRISGVFSTDDPDAFTAFLRSLKGVRVTVTATRILVSQP